MNKRTLVVHPPGNTLPPDNRPLVAPIYQSVKFSFDDVGETLGLFAGRREGHYYSRDSNPTLQQLESTLAGLQGRDGCLLTASGIAAISAAAIALLRNGDHVVLFAESYAPTRSLVRRMLSRYGVEATLLSIEDMAGLERTLAARPTRLVLFESPTNPVLKVADIARITRLSRAYGATTLLDNTLSGLHNHGEYDVDLYVHSLTKFASGHGDVMGGAVIGRRELIDAMRADFIVLGPTLDPHAAFLIQRGLRSYFVRWERQCANALHVAQFLAAHPAVSRVRYPGLASDPGHVLAREQMDGAGAVVCFDLAAGMEAGNRFAEALELFSIAASLGSTESLVVPPALQQPRGYTPEQVEWSGIGPGTVRLSIGLEDADDLIRDLGQALTLL